MSPTSPAELEWIHVLQDASSLSSLIPYLNVNFIHLQHRPFLYPSSNNTDHLSPSPLYTTNSPNTTRWLQQPERAISRHHWQRASYLTAASAWLESINHGRLYHLRLRLHYCHSLHTSSTSFNFYYQQHNLQTTFRAHLRYYTVALSTRHPDCLLQDGSHERP